MRRAGPAVAFLALALASPGMAVASWSGASSVSGYATGMSLPAGKPPTVVAVGRTAATVSWQESEGSVSLDGYEVTRYDTAGQPQTIEGGCGGVVAGLACVEGGLPPGEWTYSVTPVRANWRGVESARSAPIAVLPPVTISTSAWSIDDASSGIEADSSDPAAFAEDGRTAVSESFETSFSSTHYIDYAYNSSLAPELATSSVSFDFDFAPTAGKDTACFYFEVYAAGSLIGAHGSSGAPVSCKTGNASFQATSTPLPEVTSSTIADGLEVKVYAKDSGKGSLTVDLSTVSGTAAPSQSFTLYEINTTSSGKKGATAAPWSLGGAGDESTLGSAGGWPAEFSSSNYLSLDFPAYVPSGASIESVSLTHSYRSEAVKTDTCYFFDVYSGAALLGTHGNAASPVSCSSSNSTWVTDVISLPEVTTAAEANGLTIKMYVESSKAKASSHDLAELQLTYTP